MDRLRFHDLSKTREEIELERALRFAALSGEEKMRRLLTLMNVARKFNGGKPLKEPQGKGFIIRKKQDGHL